MRGSERCYEVAEIPGCGLGLRVLWSLPAGITILREAPLAVVTTAADPATTPGEWEGREEEHTLQSLLLSADREFARLPLEQQEIWMSLADGFSTPGSAKSPANVLRSNAFTNKSSGAQSLYASLSRVNHSCAPNMEMAKQHTYDGQVAILTLLCDVSKGKELVISCMSHAVERTLSNPSAESTDRVFESLCGRPIGR
eukprot:7384194-Prymnesium_polylepis.1